MSRINTNDGTTAPRRTRRVDNHSNKSADQLFSLANDHDEKEPILSTVDSYTLEEEKKSTISIENNQQINISRPINNTATLRESWYSLLNHNTNQFIESINDRQADEIYSFCLTAINCFTGSLHINHSHDTLCKVIFSLSISISIIKRCINCCSNRQYTDRSQQLANSIMMFVEIMFCIAVLNFEDQMDKVLFLALLIGVELAELILNKLAG